jgi:hypothetical protein
MFLQILDIKTKIAKKSRTRNSDATLIKNIELILKLQKMLLYA